MNEYKEISIGKVRVIDFLFLYNLLQSMNKQKWTEMKGTINITKKWAVVPSRQTD